MAVHPCTLIANPEGYGWHYATKIQRRLAIKDYNFDLNPVHVKEFRDGESLPQIEKNIRKRNCYFIHDSTLHPDKWRTQLQDIGDAMKRADAQEIIAVLPYLKWARQDKKGDSRVPITAKVVAKEIEKFARRVITIDVHNDSIGGFYDIPFNSLYSFKTAITYINSFDPRILEDIVTGSTDAGGITRAKAFANLIGSGYFVTDKTRSEPGEVEKSQMLGDVDGKNVLFVDDLIDSGNSARKASDTVRDRGAKKVYIYVAHGIFTKNLEYVAEKFDMMFVGDTMRINGNKPKNVHEVSFIPLVTEAIRRTSEGEDLHQLFED